MNRMNRMMMNELILSGKHMDFLSKYAQNYKKNIQISTSMIGFSHETNNFRELTRDGRRQ